MAVGQRKRWKYTILVLVFLLVVGGVAFERPKPVVTNDILGSPDIRQEGN